MSRFNAERRSRLGFAVVSLLLGALLALPAAPSGFSSGRQVQYLTFSAKDKNGVYLRDLKKEELSLKIDGRAVPIPYLGYQEVDTAFYFLIENSPRTAKYAVSMPQFGQINIVDQVRYFLVDGFFLPLCRHGRVMLAEFYKELTVLKEFTDVPDDLEWALHQLSPNVTGLDLENIPVSRMIGRAVDRLKERSEKRKILVVFTTTVDRESYQNLEEYRDLLRLSDVELYVISFATRYPSGPGYSFEERMNTYFFQQLVGATAGKAYISGEYVYVDEFMTDLMGRVSNSYTIGFYVEPNQDFREHQIELKIDRPKIEITHREIIVY